MKKYAAKLKKWLVPLCYLVFLVAWLALALLRFALDRAAGGYDLSLEVVQAEEATEEVPGVYYTQGVDPKLVWPELEDKVRTVALYAEFETPPGEMELFWTRPGQPGFSPKQRVIGTPMADGSYFFRLPSGQVQDLRLDLGAIDGNRVSISRVAVTPKLPAARYFMPSLRSICALAILPALASCAFYTIMEGVPALLKASGHRKRKTPNGS